MRIETRIGKWRWEMKDGNRKWLPVEDEKRLNIREPQHGKTPGTRDAYGVHMTLGTKENSIETDWFLFDTACEAVKGAAKKLMPIEPSNPLGQQILYVSTFMDALESSKKGNPALGHGLGKACTNMEEKYEIPDELIEDCEEAFGDDEGWSKICYKVLKEEYG